MADTIIIRSGFLAAAATVQTFLATNGVTANVEVGWKKRPQGVNQGPGGANRVVIMPSKAKGGGGSIENARFPGPRNVRNAADAVVGNVRSLADWKRKATISVWGVGENRNDEAAQIEATESLFEWVVRAVHSSPGAFGSIEWGEADWTEPVERSFGLELIAELTFSHPIFDTPRPLYFPAGLALARGTFTTAAVPDSTDGDT